MQEVAVHLSDYYGNYHHSKISKTINNNYAYSNYDDYVNTLTSTRVLAHAQMRPGCRIAGEEGEQGRIRHCPRNAVWLKPPAVPCTFTTTLLSRSTGGPSPGGHLFLSLWFTA